jgi:16S rRNA (adenine1518-N6/adenine1519-N6)-dimethyltransferase
VSFPRTTTALRAVLERHGVRPRKGHGQCFLTDPQAVDAIVRDAGVTAHDRVVEVGTGPGLLTHALAETGAEVVTFDIDAEVQRLARGLRPWPARVAFVEGDVLAGKHALAPAFVEALAVRPPPPGRLLLVSNLPYGAGTPILLGVLALEPPPDELTVMVQLEVAEKLLAGVDDPEYGAPSVAVGLKARGRILRRYGPQVFWPQPRVRSALLRLTPVRPLLLEPAEHEPFGAFVTALFTQRRKMLLATLQHVAGLGPAEALSVLEAVGTQREQRPQEVEPARMLALWRAAGRPAPARG